MDWFYTTEGQKKGPVAEEEFQWLVKDGVVTQQTLVWCLGMDEWKPYRDVPPVAVDNLPPRPLDPDLVDGVRCAGCRGSFLPDEMIPLAGGDYCVACKPLAVQRLQEGVVFNHDAEGMRRAHLKHEKSVRRVASLYFLGGGTAVFVGIGRIIVSAKFSQGEGVVANALIILFGICHLWLATGLRRFKAWTRIPTFVLSCVGLAGFPLITLFSIYILMVMLQGKTKVILSDEYRMAIEQTPQLKCRTFIIVWIMLIFLMVLMAVGALIFFMERRTRHGQ